MFSAGVIMFREILEAALVIGIILSYLAKTQQYSFKKYVVRGVFVGGAGSVFVAFILDKMFHGLSGGKTGQIIEGIVMFVTAGFLTWMILWVHRQKDVSATIRKKISVHVGNKFGMGIFLLSATSVFREGTETVLYLKATSLSGSTNQLFGAVVGAACALALGYLLFVFSVRINLKTIFSVTSILLLLFAAGLVASGVHELQEALLLPIFSFDPLVNLSSVISNSSIVGSILHALFGYTSKPSILELVSWGSYIFFIVWLERVTDKLIVSGSSKDM